MSNKYWTIVFWVLLVCWVTGALLFMARVKGGFLTNYLSDLTFPAWFYIYIRGLTAKEHRRPKLIFFHDWFGAKPLRALVSILAVGILSEVKTYYWPEGIISGTFDGLDVLAYAVGLLFCFCFDARNARRNIFPNY